MCVCVSHHTHTHAYIYIYIYIYIYTLQISDNHMFMKNVLRYDVCIPESVRLQLCWSVINCASSKSGKKSVKLFTTKIIKSTEMNDLRGW